MNKKFMLAAVMGCTMALGFSANSSQYLHNNSTNKGKIIHNPRKK